MDIPRIQSLLGQGTSSFDVQAAVERASSMSIRDIEEQKAERYNASSGDLNQRDGYDCKLCMNRGDSMVIAEHMGGLVERFVECKCMNVRRSIKLMKESGLEAAIRDYTFKRFAVNEPWQKEMLETAQAYLKEGIPSGAWFYVGGAVGCGKTHICTAICRTALYGGSPVKYMTWPAEAAKIKAVVNDDEEYARQTRKLKTVEVLYIDDLFKPVSAGGSVQPPTAADVRLAYEIVNYRYNARLPTIFSAERYISELMDIDEATASRIYERCKGYVVSVKRDRSRNKRVTGEKVV